MDQKEKCQKILDAGLRCCGDIDKQVSALTERLVDIEREAEKLTSDEKQGLLDEIKKIKDTLSIILKNKDNFEKILKGIQEKGDSTTEVYDKAK